MVDVDHLLMPKLIRSNSPPTYSGNYIAHRIKLIHDDSQSVFPESVYSTQTQLKNRWKSLMKSDFVTMDELRERAKKKKMTQQSMFMNWKVPARLMDRSNEGIPIPGIKSVSARPGSTAIRVRASAPGRLSELPAAPGIIQHSNSRRSHKLPKAVATQQVLNNYQKQGSTPLTNEFLKKATPHEKALVEKAIKMESSEMSKGNHSKNVEKWFRHASDKDKQIAGEFLKSLNGNDPSSTDDELFNMLQSGGKKYSSLTLAKDPSNESHLRYLRLLTPNTRSKKFEFQTWHHMPNYHDTDPVNNASAIYTTANGYVPRHFVIHPDWG